MPTSRLERAFALVGLAAIVTLLALTIPAWLDYRDRSSGATVAAPLAKVPAPTTRAVLRQPRSTPRPTPAESKPAVRAPKQAVTSKPVPPTLARVALTAARGDCWLLVRDGSETGRELFQGTVPQGQTLRFRGKRFWLRIGASENLNLAVAGRRAVGFADGGIRNVLITPAGVVPG